MTKKQRALDRLNVRLLLAEQELETPFIITASASFRPASPENVQAARAVAQLEISEIRTEIALWEQVDD